MTSLMMNWLAKWQFSDPKSATVDISTISRQLSRFERAKLRKFHSKYWRKITGKTAFGSKKSLPYMVKTRLRRLYVSASVCYRSVGVEERLRLHVIRRPKRTISTGDFKSTLAHEGSMSQHWENASGGATNTHSPDRSRTTVLLKWIIFDEKLASLATGSVALCLLNFNSNAITQLRCWVTRFTRHRKLIQIRFAFYKKEKNLRLVDVNDLSDTERKPSLRLIPFRCTSYADFFEVETSPWPPLLSRFGRCEIRPKKY